MRSGKEEMKSKKGWRREKERRKKIGREDDAREIIKGQTMDKEGKCP